MKRAKPTKPTFGRNLHAPLRGRGGRAFVPALLLRSLAIGLVAIAGAVWALVRHCTHILPPLRVPVAVPSAAPTYDADAGEVPVPEVFEEELGRDAR